MGAATASTAGRRTALALAAALARPRAARAASIVVDPSGAGDYASISEAVAHTAPQAHITIRPGTYAEAVRLTRPVTLEAVAPGTVTVAVRTDTPYQHCLTVGGAEASAGVATVRNVAFEHYSKSVAENYAVFVREGPLQLVLEGCDVRSTSGTGVGVEGGRAELRRCQVGGCKTHGVAVLGEGAFVRLEASGVARNGQNGVLVRDRSGLECVDCDVTANGRAGLALVDCRRADVARTKLQGNKSGPQMGYCDDDDNDMPVPVL